MSRHLFGWSYPPGCSGPPDDDVPEYHSLRCKHCKSFIGGKPVRIDSWEVKNTCNGILHVNAKDGFHWTECGDDKAHAPHNEVIDCGNSQVFVCKRCHKDTKVG